MSQSLVSSETRCRAKPLGPALIPNAVLRVLGDTAGERHCSFSDHVALQEGRCGFLDFLATAAPRYRSMVEILREDHRQLGRSLASLRMRILRGDPQDWQVLAAELDGIDAAIGQHTELEREMLRDALERG
jgi:hypothetical protein